MLYIAALIIFFAIHVIPLNQTFRQYATDKLGERPYLGVFILIIISSIFMAVQGWNSFPNIYFYEPPPLLKQVHIILMLPVTYLWVAAEVPNNLKRFVKHPMLTGMKLWAVGHLIANGDLRSMLLFISILIFSIITVRVANKREVQKQIKTTPVYYDIGVIGLSLIGYGAMLYFHGQLFGVQVISYLSR